VVVGEEVEEGSGGGGGRGIKGWGKGTEVRKMQGSLKPGRMAG